MNVPTPPPHLDVPETMEHKRVSAADVAQKAGVSRTTVSFVVNNTPGKNISEDTRQRVLAAMQDLGYTPDERARRVAMARRQTVGLYVRHSQYVYTDAFIVRTIEGMSQAVNRHRVQLIIQPISQSYTGNYVDLVRQDNLDGIILINTQASDAGLNDLITEQFPVVSLDDLGDTLAIDQVFVDNRGAACQIVEYLIGLGHRRIAMITHAAPTFTASSARLAGYRDALEAANIPYSEDLVRYADFSEQSGHDAMLDLLSLPKLPTAVFAGNDVVAYGALLASREAEISVPEEVSVVGFDDDYLSRYMSPALTTVALPASGMGSTAVSLLVERLSDPDSIRKPRRLVLPTHISIRSSATNPPT